METRLVGTREFNDRAATSPTRPASPVVSPAALGRGLAALRVFFGLIVFANGLAKIDERFVQIDVGPYHANLINRPIAKIILDFEVNKRPTSRTTKGTQLPYLKRLVNDVVLARWNAFQWVTTGIELGAGALLILGLLSRPAALADLGQQLFLAAVYFSSNRWLFEQPHEYVPLIVLALVPAGRYWGIDGLLARRWPSLARWPW